MSLRRHAPVASVVAAFALSRVLYAIMGLRFDASPLYYYWQYADPELLQGDLARTVWHLHGQPPLMNLYLGLVLKVFPNGFATAFHVIHLAGGLVLAVALERAMERLGVLPWLAALLAVIFTVSPVTVLYESWLFYHHPVTVLLALSVLALERFLARETVGRGAVFFGPLALVVLTRGIFGLLWFAASVAAVVWFMPSERRRVLAAAAGPLLVLALFTAKHHAMFGRGGVGHAHVGPNLAQRMVTALPAGTLAALERQGEISRIVSIPPMSDLGAYRGLVPEAPPTGVPVLDQERRSTGHGNQQHLRYIAISDAYLADALHLMRRYPRSYARTVAGAFDHGYFHSPANDGGLRGSATFKRVEPWLRRWERVFGGYRDDGNGAQIVVALPALLLYAAWLALRPSARSSQNRSVGAVAAYLAITIVYVTAVTTLVSWGDYSRYRFKLDALFLVVLGVALTHAMRAAAALLAAARRSLEPRWKLAGLGH